VLQLAGIALLLGLLVLELAVIEEAADGRDGVGGDLYKVEPGLAGAGDGIGKA
jgi:hypothetical protein